MLHSTGVFFSSQKKFVFTLLTVKDKESFLLHKNKLSCAPDRTH